MYRFAVADAFIVLHLLQVHYFINEMQLLI